jgi:hypothetical protein
MEIMLNLPVRVTISPNLLYQPLGAEAVILNLDNEQYYALDDMGTKLWQLFHEHNEPSVVIMVVLAEYQVDEAVLCQDIAKFIQELHTAGLIRVES